MMHLLLTGEPACGKTTLIKILLPLIPDSRGFFMQELREYEKRVGFKAVTLRGEEAVFAHKNFTSSQAVSGYAANDFKKMVIRDNSLMYN